MVLLTSIGYLLLVKGVGIWGINIPVGWGFDIVNFVWWIGIGHAGTLISAILLLLQPAVAHLDQPLRRGDDAVRRRLRRACSRSSTSAGRGSSTGCCPYPNTMGIWPQFRSPLIWDVFAVSTYATVSLLFWYVGLIPDLATLRDRAQASRSRRSSTACWRMGWRGSARHWQRYETAYLLLAGLATPLVVSVHTVVSASTSRSASSPAGTPRSSRPTSSPAPSTPASRWC